MKMKQTIKTFVATPAVPISYVYADGRLYFHSYRTGERKRK